MVQYPIVNDFRDRKINKSAGASTICQYNLNNTFTKYAPNELQSIDGRGGQF